MPSVNLEKESDSEFNEILKSLVFSDSADDFVSYEEVQNAAASLNMSIPTRSQIDAHMKTFFKILPSKQKQRDGFCNLVLSTNQERCDMDVEMQNVEECAGNSKKKRRQTKAAQDTKAPSSLLSRIQTFHEQQRQHAHALTSQIKQKKEDETALFVLTNTEKELEAKYMIDREKYNSCPSFDNANRLELLQKVLCSLEMLTNVKGKKEALLLKKNENLSNIVARSLL